MKQSRVLLDTDVIVNHFPASISLNPVTLLYRDKVSIQVSKYFSEATTPEEYLAAL